MLPLARSFALEASCWPSGQNGCRNLSKGVKCCLHPGFPQYFHSSAEGVNCRLHVLVLQQFFRIRYCFVLLSVHRSDVKHFSPAISSRCQELFTPWFPTVFAIAAAGVKNRLHFYSLSHFHISAKGVKACLHHPCFWIYSTNVYI